ncbi:substrate-binding domain-containing protein [Citrobacter sp. S2-9]|uniref:Substrate-binding domain-containing protein n=1 Tax=Citrobacter enshiensis TaxID=2971264 RepID=A0ABT8PSP9_9ENTR|nr:substrate-binding domain-containing protein [Citrobacter enshiensis]MDN8599319.1 substrate-binding domain-containing protein [Citrobacter enshiensis]
MKYQYLILSMLLPSFTAFSASPLTDPAIQHQPQDGVIKVYGPGGPHSALQKAASAWSKQSGVNVAIIYGPESKWSKEAQHDADLIFGSSQQSMTAFLETYAFIQSKDVQPLYLQRSVLAVKPGNPKGIKGINDLLNKDVGIVVTEGAGVYNTSGTGVWEDIAGRTGQLADIKNIRSKIIAFEKGSGAAFKAFQQPQADAWITWSDWPLAHPDQATLVEIEPERRIYRDMNIAVAKNADPQTQDFVRYLSSPEASKIFAHEGWMQ